MPLKKTEPGTMIRIPAQLDTIYALPTPPGVYAINDRRFKGYGPLLVKRGLAEIVGPAAKPVKDKE